MALPLISPMVPDDLDAVMRLERQCFREPWSRRMYLSDLTNNELATYLVVRPGEGSVEGALPPILAYGGFWLMVDEAHIATIASHPDWRGCGLGLWLMLALLDRAMARGATVSTLEVRAGNRSARLLYEKLGYQVAGVRYRYYRDGEDGLILTTPPLDGPAMRERMTMVRAAVVEKLMRRFVIASST
ncbi:MAG: ribosomal-protein-alanine N-acetyltransferase [Chloroflexi bacterium HGW-Chloroflexi-1]|nr:MAG: ribosomal-protein-alanine N-acetyltransferase [Chloroflexi bacterium HGW-Chloroflexi-1]